MLTANQLVVKNISILSSSGRYVDVSYLFEQITIKESMAMPAMNGSLTLTDDNDHYETVPFIGQEMLLIEFETLDSTYSLVFRIYKISNIEKTNQRRSRYTLFFVSDEMIRNEKQRVNGSFANMKYSDMVELVLKDTISTSKDLAIAESLNDANYIAPNVRPFRMINHVLRKAVASSTKTSNYVFFEDRRGYIASPMNGFIAKEPKYEYQYNDSFQNASSESSNIFSIQKIDIRRQSDALNLMQRGFFASQLHSIDLLQRKIDVYDYDYFTVFDEINHLNPNPLFIPKEEFDTEGQQYFTYSDETIADNEYVSARDANIIPDLSSEFRTKRMIQNMSFANYVINMSIMGNILLFVGDVVRINMNSSFNKKSETPHRMISGNSMVTAITHNINSGNQYNQSVELVKDSYSKPLGDEV